MCWNHNGFPVWNWWSGTERQSSCYRQQMAVEKECDWLPLPSKLGNIDGNSAQTIMQVKVSWPASHPYLHGQFERQSLCRYTNTDFGVALVNCVSADEVWGQNKHKWLASFSFFYFQWLKDWYDLNINMVRENSFHSVSTFAEVARNTEVQHMDKGIKKKKRKEGRKTSKWHKTALG